MSPIRIAIHGAAGRMGRRLVALGAADPQLTVAAALESPGNPLLGDDAGIVAGAGALGVPLAAELLVPVDVVIDFSVPKAAEAILETCRQNKLPLVLATTGFEPEQIERIRAAAQGDSAALVAEHEHGGEPHDEALRAGRQGPGRQGRRRGDSRTAPSFQGRLAQRHGLEVRRDHRQADGANAASPRPQRPAGQAAASTRSAIHAIRVGDNPGEHTIVFAMLGETLELTVRASNRDCYAQGALAAAKFLAGKPAGLYGMEDVLGL